VRIIGSPAKCGEGATRRLSLFNLDTRSPLVESNAATTVAIPFSLKFHLTG
jgi:hypothetical protein